MYLILQNCFNKHANINIEFAFIGEYESFDKICLIIQVKYLSVLLKLIYRINKNTLIFKKNLMFWS